MKKSIGVLTSGGDCPGLNAAIRAIGKAGRNRANIIGFLDGFRGLMQDRTMRLDDASLSNILTLGGTILGTSRDKPHRMPIGGEVRDMTDAMVEVYNHHHLDALICLGGGGTQKNALRLKEKGLNIITLPKTIDNDVGLTDVTFGFDTALEIATDAIDRLHSTATSHSRNIVVEIMGHKAGWLALGAGVAGGADIILIPEIPYDIQQVAAAINRRQRDGKRFSIIAVAEGATPIAPPEEEKPVKKKKKSRAVEIAPSAHVGHTLELTNQLEHLTGLESRLTILGHLQRGGSPSAADRLLATRLGAACMDLIEDGVFGVMVAARGETYAAVPLEEVAGVRKNVPLDHDWIKAARKVGTCLGDAPME
ncbi:6-phosphofructokinase [Lignipirellula cremea]|uniref:ATP-dependent 6-phosphofructokinase n=1 Tax=Lignipirellula cremea TaxID=2528010 RepID=A0A518DNJ9_9BACT|nr:ATP-dependent 6-phosphofructokinase [Lignipirellula cremea]QDU93417.1 6-phosphofructokinase [Lignipirellula cremea]